MKQIEHIKLLVIGLVAAFSFSSCEEIGVSALEKPSGEDVTVDTVFASSEYAERVLWYAYRSLRTGLTRDDQEHAIGKELQDDITDLSHNFKSWGAVVEFYYTGDINSSNVADNDWRAPLVNLPFRDYPNVGVTTFKAIRHCHLLIDNIHKVTDISENYRNQLIAEAKTIIAYNKMELFRNYGGIPWINKVYSPDDDFTNPRLTVEATVDSIVNLLDEAIPYLPWSIPESDLSNWSGRFSQAGAMALKVRLLLFAASPIFNSDQPYMQGEAADNFLTWYGNYDAARYQRAADAAEELLTNIDQLGGYELELAEGTDVWAYRDAYKEAYFSRRSSEVLISIRDGYQGPAIWKGFYAQTRYGGGTCTDEYMRMFPMADGTPLADAASWDEFVDPLGSEGVDDARKYNRDPRLYETMLCVDDDWGGQKVQTWKNQIGANWAIHLGNPRRNLNSGSTIIRKFIPGWSAGIPVKEYHFPYIRLPEIYLSYAEALNELDRTAEAYEYINRVRNRVGLNDIELVGTWDKESLREQILTERACEFGFEQVRWFDITRHLLADELSRPLHNVLILKDEVDGSYTYSYPEITNNSRIWWTNFSNKWFLLPFPLVEVQKGYGLVQNPGW